ncbi:MAG: hypothetical protein BWY04_01031 [candidate division CPR1 bacterium ADurb.Bin160]|uniref:Uncharacterized protein n=1 Tax=candidate division CPR1 bacterium ADurb.Bin160 TaxID=1852826 RepID=A0A1V5ZLU5_9BACT|nr:MAG: hypothetical protein BWY04_01031 [candidate division CPR1 bacterium ADurb.Bin160]
MVLSKESKTRLIENFYALDYLFFGKRISKFENCCPLLKEEYLTTKGALMSIMIEMYKLAKHSPKKNQNKLTKKIIFENARISAKLAREITIEIVQTKKAQDCVKKMVRESVSVKNNKKLNSIIREKITEKTFSTGADNILMARLLSESTDILKLNSWDGRILEDAYKILRTSLVESAIQILKSK